MSIKTRASCHQKKKKKNEITLIPLVPDCRKRALRSCQQAVIPGPVVLLGQRPRAYCMAPFRLSWMLGALNGRRSMETLHTYSI